MKIIAGDALRTYRANGLKVISYLCHFEITLIFVNLSCTKFICLIILPKKKKLVIFLLFVQAHQICQSFEFAQFFLDFL
jgi:hypothetical protein